MSSNKEAQLLPLHCTAIYVEDFISEELTQEVFKQLTQTYNIAAQQLLFVSGEEKSYLETGKITFIDEELHANHTFPEQIWGKTAVWFPELAAIKQKVETFTGKEFAVCVCIYYPDGNTGVAYHSDFTAFGDTTVIPSLSIGTARNFCLKEKETSEVFDIILKNGSMLIMGEHCQERYEHSLPLDTSCKKARINLTFRQYGF